MRKAFTLLAVLALLLTTVVVVLGGYVRLSDAGLGCPDWPGCYGQLAVPSDDEVAARAGFDRPLESGKAWREMIHRYAAGTLGLLVLALAVLATLNRRHDASQPLVLPWLLVVLIIFQSLLGMLTVTWLLKPLIVMGHLLGGLTTLALLGLLVLRRLPLAEPTPAVRPHRGLAVAAALGLMLLVGQIALGGWTSANYAAMACPDFPQCQGQWWPHTDFGEAFTLWRGLGTDYEFGVLDSPARTAIQVTHRLGALTLALYFATFLTLLLRRERDVVRRRWAVAVGLALLVQISLGITTVLSHLSLPVAAAHNAGAAMLLLALVGINYALWNNEPRLSLP
ncbi:MAG TPA: COX15/CtaA family protein [Gammaproteobacteria bacterium]|nr:COX15/CtaA family protein [Gammaproteobacteria bacterium]